MYSNGNFWGERVRSFKSMCAHRLLQVISRTEMETILDLLQQYRQRYTVHWTDCHSVCGAVIAWSRTESFEFNCPCFTYVSALPLCRDHCASSRRMSAVLPPEVRAPVQLGKWAARVMSPQHLVCYALWYWVMLQCHSGVLMCLIQSNVQVWSSELSHRCIGTFVREIVWLDVYWLHRDLGQDYPLDEWKHLKRIRKKDG